MCTATHTTCFQASICISLSLSSICISLSIKHLYLLSLSNKHRHLLSLSSTHLYLLFQARLCIFSLFQAHICIFSFKHASLSSLSFKHASLSSLSSTHLYLLSLSSTLLYLLSLSSTHLYLLFQARICIFSLFQARISIFSLFQASICIFYLKQASVSPLFQASVSPICFKQARKPLSLSSKHLYLPLLSLQPASVSPLPYNFSHYLVPLSSKAVTRSFADTVSQSLPSMCIASFPSKSLHLLQTIIHISDTAITPTISTHPSSQNRIYFSLFIQSCLTATTLSLSVIQAHTQLFNRPQPLICSILPYHDHTHVRSC